MTTYEEGDRADHPIVRQRQHFLFHPLFRSYHLLDLHNVVSRLVLSKIPNGTRFSSWRINGSAGTECLTGNTTVVTTDR